MASECCISQRVLLWCTAQNGIHSCQGLEPIGIVIAFARIMTLSLSLPVASLVLREYCHHCVCVCVCVCARVCVVCVCVYGWCVSACTGGVSVLV